MAVTEQPAAIQFGDIDPREESPVEQLKLQLNRHTMIDPLKIEMIYDHPSDTFSFLFYGRARPSVVVGDGDPLSLLADSETGELLGFQVENYFASAAVDYPQILETMEYADLRGITREQVQQKRHKILGYRGRLSAWARRTSWRIRMRTRSRRQAVVRRLINDDSFGLSVGSIVPSV